MGFQVGHIEGPWQDRDIIKGDDGVDILNGRKTGDIVERYGYIFQWDKDCVNGSCLDDLRKQGDDPCDNVVRMLKISFGQDGLAKLERYISTTAVADQEPSIREFWNSIISMPPHLSSFATSTLRPRTLDGGVARHHCEGTVSAGQNVFWRYAPEIFHALMHFSLTGGFSAPKVISVLQETGYLTRPNRDVTYRRLLETAQFVVDAMTDMTPITGQGWKSTIRVRMLHSQVRLRLLSRQGLEKRYSVEDDGVPINQEDMLATLGAFAVAPLWSLRRMRIRLAPEEEAAYITAWSFIGYYMGICPAYLHSHWAAPVPSPPHHLIHKSEKLFLIISVHLFSFPYQPENPEDTISFRVLSAVARRPPGWKSVYEHCEMARFLLGDGLADRLALPRGSVTEWANARLGMWVMCALVMFGRAWRRGWERERVSLMHELVNMILAWQLGRRTRFTQKKDPFPVIPKAEDSLHDPDFEPLDGSAPIGPDSMKQVIKRWRILIAELVVVTLLIFVIALGLLAIGVLTLRRVLLSTYPTSILSFYRT